LVNVDGEDENDRMKLRKERKRNNCRWMIQLLIGKEEDAIKRFSFFFNQHQLSFS